MPFTNRVDAGRQLAEALRTLPDSDLVVLGLPRGGVPVAAEVATELSAPLDVIIVRKLGVPFQPELAMGAIGEDGIRVRNEDVVHTARVTEQEFAAIEARERTELERRTHNYRGNRDRIDLRGRTALIVDDGIATGSTARAACQVARAHGAARIVLASPVAPPGAAERFADDADQTVFVDTPADFMAVGQFYADFSPTTDDEVIDILSKFADGSRPEPSTTKPTADDPPVRDEHVTIPVGSVTLEGHLFVPEGAAGVVVFVHGSGSSRHSPRNRHVATVLNDASLATLLFDLLTPAEELDRANVFDIELLAGRLAEVTKWVGDESGVAGLPLAYFGASTGAAAALWAAAASPDRVDAVVSRGGRPDLASARLDAVRTPTLLIVGGADTTVLGLNEEARAQLDCEAELTVVPDATHLFEEPGALERVARLAREWFTGHLQHESASALHTGDTDP